MSLKQLIDQCKKGDRKAQAQLYREYAPILFGISLKYSRNKTEAEDNLHDGFMTIFDKIGQYSGKGSFEGWMKRIMVNEGINYYRRVNRKGRIIYMDKEASVELHQEVQEPEVSSSLAHTELLDLVKSLSAAYRMVFTLYAIEGFSHKEIAEKLGITVSTSKSNLTRARAMLRKRLAERELLESKLRVENG